MADINAPIKEGSRIEETENQSELELGLEMPEEETLQAVSAVETAHGIERNLNTSQPTTPIDNNQQTLTANDNKQDDPAPQPKVSPVKKTGDAVLEEVTKLDAKNTKSGKVAHSRLVEKAMETNRN